MSLVVTGTDTEVGKTLVSAILLERYGHRHELAYWKPVASGAVEGRDTETVARLCTAPVEVLPEGYLFEQPLSPHLAARLEGREVSIERLTAELDRLRSRSRTLIIEGIGGLMVPLTDAGFLWIDLMERWRLPCLLVARSTLGTLNHTLLSLEALRRRGLEVLGVVLSGPLNEDNRRTIERLGEVEVVAEIDTMSPVDRAAVARVAAGFDPRERIGRVFEENSEEVIWSAQRPTRRTG